MTASHDTLLPGNWAATCAARTARQKDIRERNKTAIFDALERAGISTLTIEFDGYGDSGQVNDIRANDLCDLPDLKLEYINAPWGDELIQAAQVSLREAAENMAYDLLGDTHCGWQDGEGAYGDFAFDVAARAIRLEYSQRYTGSQDFSHEF